MNEQKYAAIAKLKVNVKSLAAEAKFIRKEAAKAPHSWIKCVLTDHRRNVVRSEARAAQLAMAALRGRDLNTVEPLSKTEPDWRRVQQKIEKVCGWYGRDVAKEAIERLSEWRKAMRQRHKSEAA